MLGHGLSRSDFLPFGGLSFPVAFLSDLRLPAAQYFTRCRIDLQFSGLRVKHYRRESDYRLVKDPIRGFESDSCNHFCLGSPSVALVFESLKSVSLKKH